MRYVRPNSLTWWAGLLAMLTGIASLALPATGPLGELSRLVALLAGSGDAADDRRDPLGELTRLVALLAGSGDASPAGLMFLGLGLIGLRDRIERGFRGDA